MSLLRLWGLRAIHPQQFLIQLFESDSELALFQLKQQAEDQNRSLEQLLAILGSTVPDFAAVVDCHLRYTGCVKLMVLQSG